MEWIGNLNFPENVQYLIEHQVSKLNQYSLKEDWRICLALLKDYKYYIWNNSEEYQSNLFPSSLWTFAHHAALNKAPLSIVQKMVVHQFPMSLPDREGKLAKDHVDESMPQEYKDLFQPVFKFEFIPLELKLIQANFHAVIMEHLEDIDEELIVLPVLSVTLEDIGKTGKNYFNIPEISVCFYYWFEFDKAGKDINFLWCQCATKVGAHLYQCRVNGWEKVEEVSQRRQ